MFSQTLLAFLLWVQLCSSNILTCFYQYDDSLLQIDYSRPQQKTIKIKSNLIENNAKGFGFWSKYIAIMDFDSFTQFTRPCDQQYEFMGQCIFNGFFFMKILDQNQDNVAAVILNMKDEPISLTHEIYLFAVGPNEYQQAKFNFEASRYQNTWYYTSIVYQDIDHKLRIFTNFEYQVQSFDYQIMTDEITILLGGYDQQLYNNYVFDGYQLLFFKGYFSPIQEYDEFGYSNDFFQGLFTQCLFQEQLTYTKIYDENAIIDPSQQQSDDFSTLSYQYQIVNNRYLVKCWVKQDYQEAFQYYLNQYDRTYLQLRQTLFHIDSLRYFLQELQGDRLLDLYYEVDFENNKETIIKISSEFIKIPVLIAQYSDENLRQYDTVIVRKDNLYELTQQWHYIIIEYGRKPVNGAIFQIQFVFLNEEHLIYNLGTQDYNTQLLGSNIIQHILRQDDNFIKSRTKIRHLKFITGYHEDNNQSELECHSSCNGCFGPMNYQCKSCYLEFNYELTSLNVCDCKYLTSFVQELQKCKPIEDFEYLQISQEKSQILCNFGYFQAKHNNEIYCIQCPEYQKERLLCGDCYHYSTTWYLKPVCTFDYIQQSAEYPFIKIVRQNIHYDVYYLDDLIQLQLLQGAADFCDDTQEDCQVSQNYHLGQQIRMKCKKNHFFENNQCQICDPYCIDCQSKDICINCIETHYFNALSQKCEFCPQECLTCTRDNNTETGYRCLTCSKFHALTQDGRCQQCGFDCEYCREDYNIIAQQYFMRCLKCTDQKVMAIRFDGINCRVIIIQNCQYVMLVSRANIWAYSTYDYNFEPKNDIDDEFPICGQCENGYGYNFYEELCEPRFYDANCVQSFYTQMLYNGAIYDYQQFCLISNYYSGPATQGDECTSQIANCKLCYNPSQFQPSFFCIECKQGYYSNHSTGQCSVCAESLNCNTCYNSIKEFNDSWKLNLQAFNQFLKQQYNQQYFFTQDESSNPQDYQLICTSCKTGFKLQDGKCIKYCDSDCQNCQYSDGQYYCYYCGRNNYHNLLSLIQYKCSNCPSYCEFCRQRSFDEMLSLNSNFVQNQKNQIYSYQCLKAYSFNQNLNYDQDFGQFIPCQNQIGCENVISFYMNLYCVDDDYYSALSLISDQNQQIQFKMKNILFDSLLQSSPKQSSFIDIEIDSKFEIMNKKFIKKVRIYITSNQEQTCSVNQISYISQKFSQNVFSLIDVQLIISSQMEQPLKIKVFQELHFLDFSFIRFENIQFEIQQSTNLLLFSVEGFKPINLEMEKIEFQSSVKKQPSSLIFQGKQISKIKFNEIHLKDLIFKNENITSIFQLQFLSSNALIQINKFQILNCIFHKVNVFEFQSNQTITIQFDQIKIQANLNVSSLLTTKIKDINLLTISNFLISGQMQNSEPFISLNNTEIAQVENLTLSDMTLIDSIFMQFEKYVIINNIIINQCKTIGIVYIICNFIPKEMSNQTHLTYFMNQITIQNLNSNYLSQIIYLQPFHSALSSVDIKNILIFNISLNNQNNVQFDQYESSVIHIELQIVRIQYCTIKRGYGFIQFLLKNIQILEIIDLQAQQLKRHQLHQFYDCSDLNPNHYKSIIKLSDVQSIHFEQFYITDFNVINSALIVFQSYSQLLTESKYHLTDFIVKENIIIVSKSQESASLIYIDSRLKTQVTLVNIEITRNQLHNYGQNLFIFSAVGVLINCPSGDIKMESNIFNSNFATNSTDTITYIFAKSVIMNSVQFFNNSIYNIDLLLKNIILSFPRDDIVRFSNLKNIFPLISEVGNSYLQAETVIVQNCQVENSSGKNGVGFYINALIIKFIDVDFKNLKTQFKNNEEHGACIFIDIPSQSSQIFLSHISVQNVISKDYGGFLYIKSDHDYLNLTLQNLTLQRCFSSKGTVLYASFQKTSLSNKLNILDVNIRDQFTALYDYFQQMINNPTIQINLNNRTSFYAENSVMNFTNIHLSNVSGESLFYCIDQGNILLNQIIIINGTMPKQSLLYIQPRNDLETVISIKGLQVKNVLQQSTQGERCQLPNQAKSKKIQNMQCQFELPNNNFERDIDIISNQLMDCLYNQYLYSYSIQQQAIITITQIKDCDIIKLQDISFINNDNSLSKSGVVFLELNKQKYNTYQISIKNVNIRDNQCGQVGCIYLNSDIYNEKSTLLFNQHNRILQISKEQILAQLKHDVVIVNYKCLGNSAEFGTCLFSNQSNILIQNSILQNNQAKQIGGTIYFIGLESSLFLLDSQILRNSAQIAGAIFYENSISQDMRGFDTSFSENHASFFGNDLVQSPEHLSITLNNYRSTFNTYAIKKNNDSWYEQLANSNTDNQVIFLPSGTPIQNYQQFNQDTQELQSLALTFRIVALDNNYSKQFNLINSKCAIETKLFDLEQQEFIDVYNQTFISQNSVYFNTTTNDYNLDDLIILFDSDNTNKKYLQLVITCDSIKIKQYDESNLIIKSFHTNYKLFVNINTYKCRVGEIKSLTDMSCHECASELDQYSLKLNSNKCNIRDEQTTLNVTSFKLNLRKGFWRPYFDNNQIEECYNLKENCIGQWDYGDSSCYLGHIGALCEQCDIQNTRGQGKFSNAQQYTCGSCDEIRYNLLQIAGFSTWTLITIVLSVKGAITNQYYFLESPYLIKIFTNYLQIISSLTSFKLNLPVSYFYFLNGVGSPIQRISYSMDCYLINLSYLDIHYIRLIWQLILPCIYFLILALFYSFLIYLNQIKYRGPIVMTAIIYMYIYFQPSLIGSLIALVSTRQISGVSWIQANVAYKFDTLVHKRWVLTFCTPFLSLFGIIIPLGLLFGMYNQRHKLIYKRGKSLFGYLYYEYKPQAYFWEIIKIITKELVILFLIFYEDSIILKGSLIYFILLFYQLLNLKYQPFKSYRLNLLDYQSTLICGASIILGIGLNMEYEFKSISNIYFFALFIINIFIIAKLLLCIINSYVNEMEDKIDVIKKKILSLLPNSLRMSHQCQRILQLNVERRKRVTNNFKRMKSAYKQFQQRSKQSSNQQLFNTISIQQITQRTTSQLTERDQGTSQNALLSQQQQK
ncbi:unnamed protein product [Paramecium octaurelia]|uniref:Transmembrane protein n=1 Tax=Paramecium octaurelia TaxID=43137 RepID=A0A8S1YQ17_PAROT|nr:unnamed protein product [Paramecium octaurelia]